jgi:acetyl-CoA carboxylase biotin carboxyl carrier protein
MTIEEIRELIKLANESGVAELEVQRGQNRVRIQRALSGGMQHVVVPGVTAPAPSHTPASGAAAAAEDPKLVVVKSPIVGTYYEAPSPGSAPFVQVGDTVHAGQVLCIIESMKLMNEIEAEVAGVVVSKLAANAQAVEYGEALFSIRLA